MRKVLFQKPFMVTRAKSQGGTYYRAMVNGEWVEGDHRTVYKAFDEGKEAHRKAQYAAKKQKAAAERNVNLSDTLDKLINLDKK